MTRATRIPIGARRKRVDTRGLVPRRGDFHHPVRMRGLVAATAIVLVALGLAVVRVRPAPPSDTELEAQLASKRTELEALVAAVRAHGVSQLSADSCEPPLGGAVERELRAKMNALGVQALSVDGARGIVMLTTYTWGLAVSGVYRGYFFCPDGEFHVPAPKGQRVTMNQRQVLRMDDHWLLYEG